MAQIDTMYAGSYRQRVQPWIELFRLLSMPSCMVLVGHGSFLILLTLLQFIWSDFMDCPDFFPWLQVLNTPKFLWISLIVSKQYGRAEGVSRLLFQAKWQSRGCISTALPIDTIVVFTIVIFFQFLNIYLWVDNSCSLDSSELPFAHENFIVLSLF